MLWRRILRVTVFASTLCMSESVLWPAGSYGIPKPVSGCPLTTGFQWEKGWRAHDTNGVSSNNSRSHDFHLDAKVDESKVQRSFCIKTSTIDDHNRPNWPQGRYCIYKKGTCPANFKEGYVYWDDDDSNKNKNKRSGTLPDGTFNENTRIEFCCRSDGEKDTPILLPSDSPFFLLAYKSDKCQMVKWAIARAEWIYYDTQNNNNMDGRGGGFPYDAREREQHQKIYYCYYTGKCKVTCTFHNFMRLQNEIGTDELYVYDGSDSKGVVLGVFYGGHPPPEKGIYSSSNHIFIIFKSDKDNSFTGFKASYFGVNISASTRSPDRTTPSEIPSSRADDPNSRGKGEPEERGFNESTKVTERPTAQPLENTETVLWPSGSYGIPKPASGCPKAEGFGWKEGWRYQDTEDTNSANAKSPQFHLDAVVESRGIKRSFCMKTFTADDSNRIDWPSGQYCIYRKGICCPPGLDSGFIKWDDENDKNNNNKSGVLPTGNYSMNTEIYFCCAKSGKKTDPIIIPAKDPFFLLAYASKECQMVKWAVASVEWIRYHTEDSNNKDRTAGVYPYNAGIKNPTIYYCYYRGCNETLASINGTFHSPNYPRSYPDGQYCSWRITINTTQQIHLIFTNFTLQHESDTDELYVYDGENATGELLGVFYGAHPPPEGGIFSSSNQLFVIFRSDSKGSYDGFNVNYYGVNFRSLNVVAVVTPVVLAFFLVCMRLTIVFYITGVGKKKESEPKELTFSTRYTVAVAYTNETYVSEEIELYTEVKNQHDVDPGGQLCSRNPLYEPTTSTDALVVVTQACESMPRFTEAAHLYTEVKKLQDCNEVPSVEQENENPLYETASSVHIVADNHIYDSTI
ncbi:CUB and sushi domain-containing protein 2 [Stylophora pistillata]|uniref:CUB and sushi domain-containing protein 2 n=1 Tax=Stylophora pistillata TaxID=50429 RepID=A0A2B4SCZ0_STYPI|nr:CUB and sushi domain-containing protein 2 [Stylophora pistillata]